MKICPPLASQWRDYRQALRDIPTYGDSFDVEITAGGTGYQEGDTFTFTKATLEDWIIADELVATVKTVDTGTGAVTALTLSGNQAKNDGQDIVVGREAKEFASPTYTYAAADPTAAVQVQHLESQVPKICGLESRCSQPSQVLHNSKNSQHLHC